MTPTVAQLRELMAKWLQEAEEQAREESRWSARDQTGEIAAVRAHAVALGKERALRSAASDLRSLLDGPTIKAEYQRALQMFAWEHGRQWKQALRDAWMRACADLPETLSGEPYRQPLQHLRSILGTSGLAKYRLPAGFTFKQGGGA